MNSSPVPFRRLAIHTLTPDTTADALKRWAYYALQYGADAFLLRRDGLADDPLADLQHKREMGKLLKAAYPRGFLVLEVQAQPTGACVADGYHVKSGVQLQPTADRFWSKACHSLDDLTAAEQAGFSAATLSPIYTTQSHPDATPLGLEDLQSVSEQTHLPIIALGGVQPNRVYYCLQHGASAVAGIACFQ